VICFFCHEEAHLPHPRNWSEYNASLKKRGSLTVWVSPEAVENWTTDELTGEQGASPTYTDLAIKTMATAQAIYGLAGRQTQGFLQMVIDTKDAITGALHLEPPIAKRITLRWFICHALTTVLLDGSARRVAPNRRSE
jgi:hypothetical protein